MLFSRSFHRVSDERISSEKIVRGFASVAQLIQNSHCGIDEMSGHCVSVTFDVGYAF